MGNIVNSRLQKKKKKKKKKRKKKERKENDNAGTECKLWRKRRLYQIVGVLRPVRRYGHLKAVMLSPTSFLGHSKPQQHTHCISGTGLLRQAYVPPY